MPSSPRLPNVRDVRAELDALLDTMKATPGLQEGEITASILVKRNGLTVRQAKYSLEAQVAAGKMTKRTALIDGHYTIAYSLKK